MLSRSDELTGEYAPPEVVLHLDSMMPSFLAKNRGRKGSQAYTVELREMLDGLLSTNAEVGPAISRPLTRRERAVAQRALTSAQFPLSDADAILEIEIPKGAKRPEQADSAIARALLKRAQNRVVGVITSEPASLGKGLLRELSVQVEPVQPVVLAARASERTFYNFTDALYVGFSIMPYLKQSSSPGSLTVFRSVIEQASDPDQLAVSRPAGHEVPFSFTALELSGEPCEAGVRLGHALWELTQKIPGSNE